MISATKISTTYNFRLSATKFKFGTCRIQKKNKRSLLVLQHTSQIDVHTDKSFVTHVLNLVPFVYLFIYLSRLLIDIYISTKPALAFCFFCFYLSL